MTVTINSICYDRRTIWNWTFSTGCTWGYPERGHECSPDGWVPAVCQRWQSAARIRSSGTQIRWSSGRVCFHSSALKKESRPNRMRPEMSNILPLTVVSVVLVWLLGRSAWWRPSTSARSVHWQVRIFSCNSFDSKESIEPSNPQTVLQEWRNMGAAAERLWENTVFKARKHFSFLFAHFSCHLPACSP